MQGVISFRQLPSPPLLGDEYELILGGKEESLWALSLVDEGTLSAWQEMEPGSIVLARAMRVVEGGMQLKIGQLHAFMPRSQTGLARGQKPTTLIGKQLRCEVLEVDPERQRVVVSRRAVMKRERAGATRGNLDRLQPGQVIHGRVSRVEPFGVFVTFGRGHEGMVHISNVSHDRIEDLEDHFAIGELIEAKILHLRRGGKRIGLGIKQLDEDPWQAIERESFEGDLTRGTVVRTTTMAAIVRIRPGIDALLPYSESTPRRKGPAPALKVGQELFLRITELDPRAERAVVSRLHPSGAPICATDLDEVRDYRLMGQDRQFLADHSKTSPRSGSQLGTNLGAILSKALGRSRPGDAATGAAS